MIELGIYGGTFAPVHVGHVAAARAFAKEAALDRLLVIPTLIPPHKQLTYNDNPLDRLNMLKLAFEEDTRSDKGVIEVSDYELNAPPPSYTVNTLRHFSSNNVHLTFLCGTDMFLTLDKWREPETIFSLSRIALMVREENADETLRSEIEQKKRFYAQEYNADIITINSPAIEISSSAVRSGNDELRQKYLPQKVYDYVKEKGLYATHN